MIFGGCVILIKNFPKKTFHWYYTVKTWLYFRFCLKESVKKTEIVYALSFDHFPVFCYFVNNDTFARESGVWKFNNSLLLNTEFVKKLKTHIEIVKSNLQENSSFSDHSKWEFLKCEIRKSSISFSKNLAKTENYPKKSWKQN